MSGKLVPCNVFVKILTLMLAVMLLDALGWSQHISRLERERAQVMLDAVSSDVRKQYYDPKLHGLDWDAKVRDAKEQIAQTTSLDVAFTEIAAALEALDDSHTFFIPPRRTVRVDYGWRWQMVGKRCYVTHVRPKSDAEAKGMKPGDQVLTINGFTPTRDDLWKMEYALILSPQRGLQVELLDPSRKLHTLDVQASVRPAKDILDFGDLLGRDAWGVQLMEEEERRLARVRYKELGPDLMIMKVPEFSQTDLEVEGMLDKARKHKALIIDLRGDPGGSEETLQNWIRGFFANDVKIADRVSRGKTTPVMAKNKRHDVYSGSLSVLVDSSSASAAEAFARVMQIEKRGTVLGDHTSGATMEGTICVHQTGINPTYIFGALVSQAELLMTDGKSIEHVGVTPDETILPSATDLANGLDPVMSRAAELAGVKLDSKSAGELFPSEWPRNPPYAF